MLRAFSLNRVLILAVSLGFAFLVLDTMIEHWDLLERGEVLSFVPTLTGVVGFTAGLVTVARWNRAVIRFMRIVLIVSIVTGLAGFYLHVREEDEGEEGAKREGSARTESGDEEAEAQEKDRPPLAPFAFAGIAAIGLLGTSTRWRAETDQDRARHAR